MTAKITADMLVFIIANFCTFKDPHITKTQKLECLEFFTNCAVGPGGVSTEELVNKCKESWVNIERSRK